ncbi:hypothetical protein M422DRAFT_272627 [Sphaerobolus stellatus SS14]|uniref:HAT C-terminal dimerisation domain-containing protein n=1 Tax=Sphaerobolus stellatus (strain SS14) TaxID=990650 RepID=A0A0C9UM34_SPHS4|nr:hypothetical protein M422DRAFT_272627 [Sphaerobolus stellatus SS14]
MFHKYLQDLKKQLNGSLVKGKVSFTCDVWQASNIDTYFAVITHWIEAQPGKWELHAALIGFTCMNESHNGLRLGQALYKIIARIDLVNKYIGFFIFELMQDEKDVAKRVKIQELTLNETEWGNLKEFFDVLGVSDKVQQAFSSDTYPALYMGIPALEAMHVGLTRKHHKKVVEYYDRTGALDAYLDHKFKHLEKHWDRDFYQQAYDHLESIFASCHKEIYADGPSASSSKKSTSRLGQLLQELESSDKEDTMSTPRESIAESAAKPWKAEFIQWMEYNEWGMEGKDVMTWWGKNAARYPVWASLALDYLPIMASSVSSERAFSAAGITIIKHHNQLKGDIVESLQVLKCAIRKELLVKAPMPSSALEKELEEEEAVEMDDGRWEAAKVVSEEGKCFIYTKD